MTIALRGKALKSTAYAVELDFYNTDFDVAPQAGDVLLGIFYNITDSESTPQVYCSNNGLWTTAVPSAGYMTGAVSGITYARTAPLAGAIGSNIFSTPDSSYDTIVGILLAFSGVDSGLFDGPNTAYNGLNINPTTSTLTTRTLTDSLTKSDDLLLAVYGSYIAASETFTAPSGMGLLAATSSANVYLEVYSQQLASAAAPGTRTATSTAVAGSTTTGLRDTWIAALKTAAPAFNPATSGQNHF